MKKKWIALLALMLALTVALALVLDNEQVPLRQLGTDLGGFSGGSDFGGGGGGGGSFGGGSGYSGGSSRRRRSGSGSLSCSDLSGSTGIIVFGLFVWIVILFSVSERNSRTSGRESQPAGARRTAQSELRAMSEYKTADPLFSEQALREKLEKLYRDMQTCCTKRDIFSLRPYFSDALFTQFGRQMEELKRYGRINYVDVKEVSSVTLRGWFSSGGEDIIIAELMTRIIDYTEEEKAGTLISGSRTAVKQMTYEYELCRPTGMRKKDAEKEKPTVCPNCGAEIEINESAKCPYCGGVITVKDHDWVVRNIKGIRQVTLQEKP